MKHRGVDWILKTCLVVFHLLILLVFTSYLRAVFTFPHEVVSLLRTRNNTRICCRCQRHNIQCASRYKVYHLPGDVHVDMNGNPRRSTETYCSRCRGNRPPRTHHCSFCGRYVGTTNWTDLCLISLRTADACRCSTIMFVLCLHCSFVILRSYLLDASVLG
jgi:RNA polymerase subunit RPABC4/transcription elongation factor Spt4